MKQFIIYVFCICFLFSCEKIERPRIQAPVNTNEKDDTKLIVNDTFSIGDVRRYGIFPNQTISNKKLAAIIEFSSGGPQLYFPKGFYPINLNIVGLSHISIYFDDATLGGGLTITDKENHQSSKIAINGNLKILDKIFIRESNNLFFENVTVKTDTLGSIYNSRNRGVSIYVGSKNIKFEKLKILNTGGDGSEFYTYVAAALQVHGWKNNPEYITINELEIQNAARTALYLTGQHHLLKKVQIKNFGFGSDANMFGLEDTKKGDEKMFSGAWINKCNDCVIDSLAIANKSLKGAYSINFGVGTYSQPTFINNVQFSENAKNMPLKDDPLTNILVKKTY
ncbi:hypothetical protein [Gelidibacter maritimus]|uniref:Uncharacterized protein n=1 Tax=Gelidibacter maritimus TaxID=2761487 RepID=A0A7W2M3A4_9FLAO|nr:hypothetical protein [Gelidibacter maritimus]MBA6151928.1 hypothetical protein [Gelidibacter maritimus]